MAKYAARHAAANPRASQRKQRRAARGERHQVARAQGARRSQSARPKGGHRFLKRAAGLVAAVAVAAGLAYGGGLYYFRDHFIPNTTVNGQDVSLKSEAEVAAGISSTTNGYTSTVTAGDFSYTISGSDIDLKTDGESAARDALAQLNVYEWPLAAVRGTALTVQAGVSFDDQKLQDVVAAAVEAYNGQAQQPQDATWTYSSENADFEVVPEVAGTAVDGDVVVKAAEEGVSELSSATTCDGSATLTASRTADDPALTAAVDEANRLASSGIDLTYDGEVKARVSREKLSQWVTIADDLTVGVDEDAIASYVADTVAPSVKAEDEDNTYAVAPKSLTAKLVEGVEQQEGSVEIPMTKTAKPKVQQATSDDGDSGAGTSSQANSSGSSLSSTFGAYIDVDLTNQYARYYDASGELLWESNIVSGNESENRSTPTGTYEINSKATDQTLIGADEDGDGEPDYKSHVTYWMPFIGNSVGLHDATWRGTFGGEIYETGGSHGCINLPYAKAASLYDMISVGTTVYVHR